ncbi:MAG: hypothetical protein KC457_19465, partial [Myxococcales bacterium]|nr:hypothetical protein [Myxococcales bacterium]
MTPWIALAALLAGSPINSNVAERDIEEIFEQPRYLFCQRGNDYQPEYENDLRWCELARDSYMNDRCPGYELVCGR